MNPYILSIQLPRGLNFASFHIYFLTYEVQNACGDGAKFGITEYHLCSVLW